MIRPHQAVPAGLQGELIPFPHPRRRFLAYGTSAEQLLDDGRMIYRVRPDGLGLERRVDPVAHAQATIAADPAEQAGFPAAGERLLSAWIADASVGASRSS